MAKDNGLDYYRKKLTEIMKKYDTHEKQLAGVLADYFDSTKVNQLVTEVRNAVETLLPELPYIGGEANVATQYLVDSAFALPLFLALEKESVSRREMARLLYLVYESIFQLPPVEKRQQLGEFYFTDQMIDMVRKQSEVSQLKQYPADWVDTFIQGDGKDFDYGYDVTECGIMKFYKHHQAERFVPMVCLTDYANYRSLGVGFKRTKKLATGDPICEFRFKKDYQTPKGWPPENLEEIFPF
jgi:hypothetical protein